MSEEDEIDRKEFIRYTISAIMFGVCFAYARNRERFLKVTDFLFVRREWYRRKRNRVLIRTMPKVYGDARNHFHTRWQSTEFRNLCPEAIRHIKRISEKRFVYDVEIKGEKIDLIKDMGLDENLVKRYSRNDKIDTLLR